MSRRKENIYNRGSGSKNIRPEGLNRTRCGPVNLNSTFANVPGPRSVMKYEMSSIFFPAQPTTDYDLQCDITYSNYLQAILSRQCSSIQIKKHNLSLNDQFSKYADILFKKEEILDELKQHLKENDIKNIINELINTLESKLNNNLKELTPEIENRFHKIVLILHLAYNQLYLTKVKPFDCQTEYNKLQELLSRCNKTMSKILNASGDTQKYQSLNDHLDHFQNLQTELAILEKSVKELQADINKLTLENVSDMLYKNSISIYDLFDKQ